MNNPGRPRSLSSPIPPTLSDRSTAFSASTVTMVSTQYNLTEFEKLTYYHGVSVDPPELLYRSDWLENPFPRPTGRIQYIPTKSAYGVFNTPLNPIRHTAAPKIRDELKGRKIRYSGIHAARFVTHGEGREGTLGPVVIWIATYPGSTTADDAHFASPDILALLRANGVQGAVVEWFEGSVEKLSGPALLRATQDINPTYHVRRFLTAGLGMPIATAEREDDDARGSVAFFFHENKDRRGNPSKRVLGVSNCHVLRKDTSVPYLFEGAGAPPEHVRLAGLRRFQHGLDDIKAAITSHGNTADTLARDIVDLEQKLSSEDAEEADEAQEALVVKRAELAKTEKDITTLVAFYKDVSGQWGDIARRTIGHVDWAPEIFVDVTDRRYTKDMGTFEVDAERFGAQFKGNVVDLGAKYTSQQLVDKFYPHSNGRTVFKFPANRQLRINGFVTRELLANPDTFDSNGEPCIVVMKDGNTSDLTVGRYAGLEAYTCDELGVESVELVIYNYNKQSGPFSTKGDSGSLVFDGQGKMVGILHSGLAKGGNSHVTYATPAWWAIEQIKAQYPHADFNRESF
ncbi:hypothetical protein FRC11_008374 [Ceratobasidium sp. 423]|nr:hypothetical protein FRC11_008374 [Ceratobasidium sp. 423]